MRSLLYIGILLCGFSCARNAPCLHPGDLLFQVGETSEMTGAITAATGKERQLNYSHVGIAVRSRGVDSVLEGTSDGGVRVTALGDFLARSARIDGRPAVTVMRLRDTTGVAAAIERARKFIGQPYDYSFRPDNGKMYCSELVWESYLAPDGSRRFPARPMNFPRRQTDRYPGSGQNCLPDWERRFPRIFPERIPTTWHAIRNSKRSPAAIDMALPKRAAR